MYDPENAGDLGVPERVNPFEKARRDCEDELAEIECREGPYSDAEQAQFMEECIENEMRRQGFL